MFRDRGEVAFQAMVPLLLAADLLEEPASMELLERSLTECRLENVMGVMLEGGGNIFSELVCDALCWGVLGTPKGDALIDLAMAHGADWASLDGWSLTPKAQDHHVAGGCTGLCAQSAGGSSPAWSFVERFEEDADGG